MKSSESEVLAMVKGGQIDLTASIQVDGFRKCAASQLPSVSAWIAAQILDFTPLTPEGFLSVAPVAWYLRRNGEVYGPLSQHAVLRLRSVLIDGDEVFSLALRARFIPADMRTEKMPLTEKAAA